MDSKQLWSALQKLRAQAPIVHNITNFVVMNNSANALLALGASPVMAHAREEVREMIGIAASLVVNIGTLSPSWVDAMALAMREAATKGVPIVLDPVGAGATPYRTQTSLELIKAVRPQIIRGNASEIMTLGGDWGATKGVDSAAAVEDAHSIARTMAAELKNTIVVSGPVDYVTDGDREFHVHNGHPMMPRVTGLGCTASALIGAFAALLEPFDAASAGMLVMGMAGEMAAREAAGPGTLQLHFIDALYQLDAAGIDAMWRQG